MLHRHSPSPAIDVRPTGVVLIDEPGRALTSRDVEHALGVPVVAEARLDPAVARAVDAGLARSPGFLDRCHLVAERSVIDVIAERSPLGGLERWLGDPTIDEVIVNGRGDVWIERGGTLCRESQR